MPPKRTSKIGILGVPKRSAAQMMVFGRFAEPLSSDDSEEDPDFELQTEHVQGIRERNQGIEGERKRKRKKESKTSTFKRKSKKPEQVPGMSSHPVKPEEDRSHEQGGKVEGLETVKSAKTEHWRDAPNKPHTSVWSDMIPAELLVKIFRYVVQFSGAVPFLCRVSRVCQRWRSIAAEPQLWKQVDLSNLATSRVAATNALVTMLSQKRLSGVEQLNLDNWTRLTDKSVETIARHCPQLRTIGLWGCENITGKAVSALISNCCHLTSLDVSMTKVNIDCIRLLVKELGHQLEELYLRNCKQIAGSQMIPVIQGACRNLKVLDVTGTFVRHLNVEKLQAGCPKLQELFLGNLWLSASKLKRSDTGTSKGFCDLEKLSLSCGAHAALSITNDLVHRLLSSSTKLRVLDLRGCTRVSTSQLKKLPATSLEELFLSQTEATYTTMAVIVEKWNHSLQVLDLSSNIYIGNDSLELIANFIMPNVTSLDLSATSVTGKGVRSVLEGCPKLRGLNLSSCRGVPRGLKQHHVQPNLRTLVCKLTEMGFYGHQKAVASGEEESSEE